ncbi:hypothetical protein LSAT2_023800 [Lamellibrachia satsuma]|nr:hypothetical protein LSAT2_023800 [Lamellibrachia satsuma]
MQAFVQKVLSTPSDTSKTLGIVLGSVLGFTVCILLVLGAIFCMRQCRHRADRRDRFRYVDNTEAYHQPPHTSKRTWQSRWPWVNKMPPFYLGRLAYNNQQMIGANNATEKVQWGVLRNFAGRNDQKPYGIPRAKPPGGAIRLDT